jgi:ATP phosphoribosyltransferase regulatory subunit HisZ
MDKVEYRDAVNGRLYEALQDGEHRVIVGPPEGLVDALGLPEPFATHLHNALYSRHVYSYREAQNNRNVQGALQEALQLDVQNLTEIFLRFETEEVLP